jgi:uncharacterized small protein (DUF1192 family)
MFDEDLPRRKDDVTLALTRQSLDPLSIDELRERIAVLKAEILRTENHIAAASSTKLSAEALFRKSGG